MLYAEETPMGELKQAARNLGLQFPKKISKLDLLAMLNAAPDVQETDPAFVNAMEGVIDAVAAHIAETEEVAHEVQVPGGDLVVALHPETAAEIADELQEHVEAGVAMCVDADVVQEVNTRKTSKGIKIEKDRQERNGIKMPSAGGACREVWDYCTEQRTHGAEPTAKSVKLHAAVMGWNLNNASIEFYNWRKFWR